MLETKKNKGMHEPPGSVATAVEALVGAGSGGVGHALLLSPKEASASGAARGGERRCRRLGRGRSSRRVGPWLRAGRRVRQGRAAGQRGRARRGNTPRGGGKVAGAADLAPGCPRVGGREGALEPAASVEPARGVRRPRRGALRPPTSPPFRRWRYGRSRCCATARPRSTARTPSPG